MTAPVTTSPQTFSFPQTTSPKNKATAETVNNLLSQIENGGQTGEKALSKLNKLSAQDSNHKAIKSSFSIADKELLSTIADSGNKIAKEMLEKTDTTDTSAKNLTPAEPQKEIGGTLFAQPKTLALA